MRSFKVRCCRDNSVVSRMGHHATARPSSRKQRRVPAAKKVPGVGTGSSTVLTGTGFDLLRLHFGQGACDAFQWAARVLATHPVDFDPHSSLRRPVSVFEALR